MNECSLIKFIYLFIQQTFVTNYVPGTVLGNGDTTVCKTDKISVPMEFIL